ncbi:hypothetical protein GQR58_001017 [Nymphon striatum]|nr:hypothetical protein GQR58_001017 [Nymphon striatum]
MGMYYRFIMIILHVLPKSVSVLQSTYNIEAELLRKVQLRNLVTNIVKKVQKFKKLTIDSEFKKFSSLCAERFFGRSPTHRNRQKVADPIPSTSSNRPCQKCISLLKRLNTAGKLRKDIVKQYHNRITGLKAQLLKKQSVRVLNQKIKRKDNKINELKQSTDIELRAKLHQANRNVNNLKRKYERLEQSRKDQLEVKKLKLDLQAKNDIIDCLEHEVDSLKPTTGDTSIRENKKKFPLMTRAFVYDALVNQVPTGNIPVLLKLSASRFSGIELATNDIPHRTTVEQMARELGIICDIQSVESIFKHENATLGFDATTQEGVHINSIHVTFASAMCLVIAIDQLPRGTADDYFLHVTTCSKCASLRKRLAKAIASKKVIVDQSKRRINLERYKLKIKKSSRVLQQTVKRKNEQLFRNKQKYCETVAYSQLTEAKKDNRCLKRKNLKLESDLEEQPEVKRLKLQIDAQNNKIENLESQLDMSQKEVSDEFSRDSKNMKVPISTRLFVYECLINQVPTASVRHLFRQSAAIFGVHLNDSDLPHQTTVAQMCRELGVITDIQAVTQILKEKDLTLGFDATTQEGIHVNAIHLTFAKDRCQVVAVIQLAGGTAADYCSHIIKSFDRLAQNYSAYNKINLYDCKKDIICRISNSMTDRVATNHATIVLVNRAWDKSLNELNCHLHPLDTIASSVRETLKKNETDKGKLFGTDCFSGNVVLQMNKLRYMDAKGDPAGFKTMLIKNNLPLGYIPRYRGNRLHVYFNICGKLTCEYSSFEEFLSSGTECGGLRTALLADFRSITTITQMQVVGYIGKLLTGPWMMKFYTSFANEISHLAGIKVVKDVISAIKKKRLDTQSSILNRTTDFFGDLLKRSSVDQPSTSKECELSRKDEVLSALQKDPKDSVLFHQLTADS